MMWRLKELPRYSTAESKVEAHHYNQIRLALLRLPNPIRLTLAGLSHIDMIIDGDSWVCVDTSLNDLPIAAWTDFEPLARQGLHEPVPCILHYFHYQAGMLIPEALDAAQTQLAQRLAHPPTCPLPGKKRPHTERNGLHAVP